MAYVNSVVSVLALSIGAATASLVACSGNNGDGTPSGDPYAGIGGGGGAPFVSTGGVPVGTGTTALPPPTTTGTSITPPVGAGGTPPVTGTGFPTFGAGGTPPVTGTGLPPAAGAPPVVGAGGATAVGGAPGGGATGVGGSSTGAGGASTGTWDPTANLDANGNLIPPATGAGFQLLTPTFDLEPGQEIYNCFHVATPNTAVFPVGEWDSQMSPGSHHFILYRSDADATATQAGVLTSGACTQGFGGSTWLYTMGAPRGHLLMPDGVAMELTPNEHIDFDMHYINTGADVIHAHIGLNVNKVKAAMYQKADAEISFNTGIFVPPMGTQTVSGTCPAVPGASYFLMQTHMHKHGTLATISRVLANGQMGEELVHTTNWDSPEVKIWQQAPFFTFNPGEHFAYSCSYKNDTSQIITVGISAATNEMCMMETYFFPAAASTPQCN